MNWKKLAKPQERINYKQAKNTVRAVNIITFAVLAWLLIPAITSKISFFVMAIIPFMCMYLLREYNGVIIYEQENGNKPNLGLACVMVVCGMIIRIASDYSIYSYQLVWIYSVSGTVLFVFIFEAIAKLPKESFVLRLVLNAIYGFFYCFAMVIFLNCTFNKNPSNYFTAKILDKYETKGKTSSNNFVLEKWYTQTKNEIENVNQKLYDSRNIGDNIDIEFYDGTLGIGWYKVK